MVSAFPMKEILQKINTDNQTVESKQTIINFGKN